MPTFRPSRKSATSSFCGAAQRRGVQVVGAGSRQLAAVSQVGYISYTPVYFLWVVSLTAFGVVALVDR